MNLKKYQILFNTFFKAGTFTFAGGLAMLPSIEREIVIKHELMDRETFLEYATLAQTLPGIIALNCACFVGKHIAGNKGMLVAGFASTISAFVLMLLATIGLTQLEDGGWLNGVFTGVQLASSVLILSAAFTLGQHNIKKTYHIFIMVGAFIAVSIFNISAPWVILGAIVIAILLYVRRIKA